MYQFENLLSMSSFKASEKVIFFFLHCVVSTYSQSSLKDMHLGPAR